MRILTALATTVRVFLGLTFFTAGMSKLTLGDYESLIGPVWLVERMAPYGLGLWATFVAWSQMLIGLTLLSRRLSTVGAIMLVPMLANILVVTISLGWRGTPYVNAVLLAMNLLLLFADRHRLMRLVIDTPGVAGAAHDVRSGFGAADAAWLAAVVLCVAGALLHPVDRRLTFALSIVGLVGLALVAVTAGRATRAPRLR